MKLPRIIGSIFLLLFMLTASVYAVSAEGYQAADSGAQSTTDVLNQPIDFGTPYANTFAFLALQGDTITIDISTNSDALIGSITQEGFRKITLENTRLTQNDVYAIVPVNTSYPFHYQGFSNQDGWLYLVIEGTPNPTSGYIKVTRTGKSSQAIPGMTGAEARVKFGTQATANNGQQQNVQNTQKTARTGYSGQTTGYGNSGNTAGTSTTPSYYTGTYNSGYVGSPDTYIFNGYVPPVYNANNMYNKVGSQSMMSQVGNFQVVTAAPLVNEFDKVSTTSDQYQSNTWYASGSSSFATSMSLSVALDPTQDLSGLDIAVKYPRGTIVYAQNFQTDGTVLKSENYGIQTVQISVADPNVRPQNYVFDKRPLLIPERMRGQKLILTLGIMDMGSQWDSAIQGANDLIYGVKV